MTPKQPFVTFFRWAALVFVLLLVSSKIEHKVSLAVGSRLSPAYAQWITDLHTTANAVRVKNPDQWRYVTTRMGFASFAVYGVTAGIIAGLIVWWRRDSRGANEVLHSTLEDQRE